MIRLFLLLSLSCIFFSSEFSLVHADDKPTLEERQERRAEILNERSEELMNLFRTVGETSADNEEIDEFFDILKSERDPEEVRILNLFPNAVNDKIRSSLRTFDAKTKSIHSQNTTEFMFRAKRILIFQELILSLDQIQPDLLKTFHSQHFRELMNLYGTSWEHLVQSEETDIEHFPVVLEALFSADWEKKNISFLNEAIAWFKRPALFRAESAGYPTVQSFKEFLQWKFIRHAKSTFGELGTLGFVFYFGDHSYAAGLALSSLGLEVYNAHSMIKNGKKNMARFDENGKMALEHFEKRLKVLTEMIDASSKNTCGTGFIKLPGSP